MRGEVLVRADVCFRALLSRQQVLSYVWFMRLPVGFFQGDRKRRESLRRSDTLHDDTLARLPATSLRSFPLPSWLVRWTIYQPTDCLSAFCRAVPDHQRIAALDRDDEAKPPATVNPS